MSRILSLPGVLLVCVVVIAGCSGTINLSSLGEDDEGERGWPVSAPLLPSGWELYHDDQNDFQIGYPLAWKREDGPMPGWVSFIDPKTRVGIDIAVGGTRETDVGKYVEANRIPALEGALYENEGPISINGRQGYKLVLTLPSKFFGPVFKPGRMKHRQLVFLSGGRSYVITATALASEYDIYADTFDTAMKSVVVQ